MSAALRQLIVDEIRSSGPMSFARFMDRALYEPGLGYYARDQNPTGKSGDFITSVTVGACFGQLLAEQIYEFWTLSGKPAEFHLVEQGANQGQLMNDIVTRLRSAHPDCAKQLVCHFIEPLDSLQAKQSQLLPDAVFHREVPEFIGEHGVYFCNELIDAFPVTRLRWNGERWREMMIDVDAANSFVWSEQDTPAADEAGKTEIPAGIFAQDFTTEFCPTLRNWAKSVSSLFNCGLWIVIDYGLLAEEYYSAARPDGTLRGYQHHQMVTEDFLSNPGEIDLTAHVNWTTLETAAQSHGMTVLGLVDQMRFLTALAEPMLKEMETVGKMPPERLVWLRQFQTLTHPGHMGTKFQAMLLGKGCESLPRLLGCKFNRHGAGN